MEKTVINRKLEIMQDIADLVRTNGEIELWRDVAALVETEEYRRCEDFSEKMNMELTVIEKKVPAEAKPVYKIRFKLAMLKGVEVFGGPSKFLQWIDKQAGAFGGKNWRSLITSEAGLQKVLDELARISDNIGRTN
jgi:hypothetical protein